MLVDAQGLGLTGPRAAVAAYDRAIGHLVRFQAQVVDAAREAAAGCVMGRLLSAYLGLMSTEEGAVSAAREALGPYAAADADESALHPRERAHLAAAVRAGRAELASALVSERLANRECSTYAWSKRALLLARAGDTAGAAAAAA